MKPLNGERTHPLSDAARKVLHDMLRAPIPRPDVNPGVANRLLREDILALVSPRWLDDFLHEWDLFEGTKRLLLTDAHGDPVLLTLSLHLTHDQPDYPALVASVRGAIEQEGTYRPLAVFSPGHPGAWRDEACRHVSTGAEWMALSPLLAIAGCADLVHE